MWCFAGVGMLKKSQSLKVNARVILILLLVKGQCVSWTAVEILPPAFSSISCMMSRQVSHPEWRNHMTAEQWRGGRGSDATWGRSSICCDMSNVRGRRGTFKYHWKITEVLVFYCDYRNIMTGASSAPRPADHSGLSVCLFKAHCGHGMWSLLSLLLFVSLTK